MFKRSANPNSIAFSLSSLKLRHWCCSLFEKFAGFGANPFQKFTPGHTCSLNLQNQYRYQNLKHKSELEISNHIQAKIKMPNSSQESSASSKSKNQDLKDMDVLCNFKIKIEPKFRICVY